MFLKFIEWLSNWNNVTGLLAIISFIMTTTFSIRTFLSSRQKLSFRIHEAVLSSNGAYFFLQIENLSHLPVAITRIELCAGEKRIDCTPTPTLISLIVTHWLKKDIITQYYSLQIPIDISTLGAVSGYILFYSADAALPPNSTTVTFIVSTNRGHKKKITLPLPKKTSNET